MGRAGLVPHSLSLSRSIMLISFGGPPYFRLVFRLCFAGSNPVEQFKSKKNHPNGRFFLFLVAGAGHSTTTYTNTLKNIKFILKIALYFLVDVIHSLAPYIPSFSKRQEQIYNIKFHNYKI